MSTHDKERRELDDVLTAYLASGAMDSNSLERWIERYPEYEKELTNFAVARMLSDSMPIDPGAALVTDSTFNARDKAKIKKRWPAPRARRFTVAVASRECSGRMEVLMA